MHVSRFQKMWKIRSQFTRDEEHEECNCFLMVVMCHGSKHGGLLDQRKNKAFKMDQLVEEVSATKSLNEKPKLFVFDTCRGGTHGIRFILHSFSFLFICMFFLDIMWKKWICMPT